MPIEIRELNIKVNINEPEKKNASEGSPDTGKKAKDSQSIIAECLEQVMMVMKNKKER